MQGEGSALLRGISLALSILWGVLFISMVCTSVILQDGSLSARVDLQTYQQVVDSLHGQTSIPASMLVYPAFGIVTGIVGYRAGDSGKHRYVTCT